MKIIQLIFGLLLSISSLAQNNPFGDYYQIGAYKVKVPFAGEPNITTPDENEIIKVLGYQYAYEYVDQDVNFLYGIEVTEVKHENYKSSESKMDLAIASFKMSWIDIMGGKLIKEEKVSFNAKNCFKQKIKIQVPDQEEIYINSLFIVHNDIVCRIYTFTPLNADDNKKINDFFEAVKFE